MAETLVPRAHAKQKQMKGKMPVQNEQGQIIGYSVEDLGKEGKKILEDSDGQKMLVYYVDNMIPGGPPMMYDAKTHQPMTDVFGQVRGQRGPHDTLLGLSRQVGTTV